MKKHRLIACLLCVIGTGRMLADPGSGTLNLVTGQPGFNTLNVTVSASTSGLTASDTRTTTATGLINALFQSKPRGSSCLAGNKRTCCRGATADHQSCPALMFDRGVWLQETV